MNEKTFICCHSPSLAFLLYETNKADSSQIGFLLGTVKNVVIKCATDENESNEEEKTVIYVEHCVPLPSKNIFNPYGKCDEKLMSSFCQDFKDKVIGWYSFRRNCKTNNCSFRDNLIHKNLLHYFQVLEPENFVLGIISANAQFCRSTHDFNYTFLRYRRSRYEPLKFKIYCLSDKPCRSNGYITNSFFPVSQDFCQIERALPAQSAIKTVSEIRKSASERLSFLSNDLMTLEDKKKNLQDEVNELQRKIRLNPKPIVGRSTLNREPNDCLLKFNPRFRYSENDNPITPLLLSQAIEKITSENQRQKNKEITNMDVDRETMAREAPQKDASVAPPELTLQENQTKCVWNVNNSAASCLFSATRNSNAGTSNSKGESPQNETNLPTKYPTDSNRKSSNFMWRNMEEKSAGDGTSNSKTTDDMYNSV